MWLFFCIGIVMQVLPLHSVMNLWLVHTVKSKHCFPDALFATHPSPIRNLYILLWKSCSDLIVLKIDNPSLRQLFGSVEKYQGTGVVCWAASCPDNNCSLLLWFLLVLGYQSVAAADCCGCSLAIFSFLPNIRESFIWRVWLILIMC